MALIISDFVSSGDGGQAWLRGLRRCWPWPLKPTAQPLAAAIPMAKTYCSCKLTRSGLAARAAQQAAGGGALLSVQGQQLHPLWRIPTAAVS